MNKLIAVLILLHTLSVVASEPEERKNRFSFRGYYGGMMLHTGYVKSKDFTIYDNQGVVLKTVSAKGMPFGIGGAIKFQFGDYFRFGGEGHTSTLIYDAHGSFSRQSWGGIALDGLWRINKWTPFVGVVIGGGKTKNLTFLAKPSNQYQADTYNLYRQYTLFLLNPCVGVEYAVGKKLNLILKCEYQVSLKKRENDWSSGLRVYFGIMFNRIKKD